MTATRITDYIPQGKENAVTRERLCNLTGLSDRKLREEIEHARRKGTIIINGVKRLCECCGDKYVAHKRSKILCSKCQQRKGTKPKRQNPGLPQEADLIRMMAGLPAIRKTPPKLVIGNRYRFIDLEHGTKSNTVKTGRLVQITDYFAVFDNGRYKISAYFDDIKGAC